MREKFLEILSMKWRIVCGFLFILIIFIYREQTFADMELLNIVKINADFDEIDIEKGPINHFFTGEDLEFIKLHYNTESNRRAKVDVITLLTPRLSDNGCKNEFEDDNEKSCSRFENRVPR